MIASSAESVGNFLFRRRAAGQWREVRRRGGGAEGFQCDPGGPFGGGAVGGLKICGYRFAVLPVAVFEAVALVDHAALDAMPS
jgi:hypothetical protein